MLFEILMILLTSAIALMVFFTMAVVSSIYSALKKAVDYAQRR